MAAVTVTEQPAPTSRITVLGDVSRLKVGNAIEVTRAPWPFVDVTGSAVRIEHHVTLSSGVYIHTHSHEFHRSDWRLQPHTVSETDTVICEEAFLGVNVQILHSCKRVGKSAVIAAGAIVTKDVPDYEIWAGNPAQKIGAVERKCERS